MSFNTKGSLYFVQKPNQLQMAVSGQRAFAVLGAISITLNGIHIMCENTSVWYHYYDYSIIYGDEYSV